MIESFQSCLTNDKKLFSLVNYSRIEILLTMGDRQLTALPATSGVRGYSIPHLIWDLL